MLPIENVHYFVFCYCQENLMKAFGQVALALFAVAAVVVAAEAVLAAVVGVAIVAVVVDDFGVAVDDVVFVILMTNLFYG